MSRAYKFHKLETDILLAIKFLIVFLLTSLLSYSQNYLPFDVNSKEYNFLKEANKKFDDKLYLESISDFDNCHSILKTFPFKQYKFSIALYKTKHDTIRAKQIFYSALKNGLSFNSIGYFQRSPLVKELSLNSEVYNLAKSTCYPDSTFLFKEIRQILINLREKDQGIRTTGSEIYTMTEVDSLNRIVLDSIINIIGWPGYKEVGKLGANGAFLVAQHSDNDLDFQKKCLDLMQEEYILNNISTNHYAMLVDRYLVNTGEKQIFGSQVFFDESQQKVTYRPCQYPEELNFLRSLYYFGDIESYLAMMQDKY